VPGYRRYRISCGKYFVDRFGDGKNFSEAALVDDGAIARNVKEPGYG